MPKLYYCSTIYTVDPPSDINPLILQLYNKQAILVLCAWEEQQVRILGRGLENVTPIGWWEARYTGLINGIEVNTGGLSQYKAVVILDRPRVDECFLDMVKLIENACR